MKLKNRNWSLFPTWSRPETPPEEADWDEVEEYMDYVELMEEEWETEALTMPEDHEHDDE